MITPPDPEWLRRKTETDPDIDCDAGNLLGTMRHGHAEPIADKHYAWAVARIEALEFEVEHERYNVEKTAQEAASRIKALEAALDRAVTRGLEQVDRIATLEAALQEIDNMAPATCEVTLAHQMADIARAARAPETDK